VGNGDGEEIFPASVHGDPWGKIFHRMDGDGELFPCNIPKKRCQRLIFGAWMWENDFGPLDAKSESSEASFLFSRKETLVATLPLFPHSWLPPPPLFSLGWPPPLLRLQPPSIASSSLDLPPCS
jgi:hypothetical protein